jgi:prefoldin subunit 5
MSDKASKKRSKQLAKKVKKKSPNRKLKKHMIWVGVIIFCFLLSKPVALMFASSSIGSISKQGATVNGDNNISAQFVSATAFKKANLVEIDVLVDLPAEALNYELKPRIYGTNKKLIEHVTVEKINAYYYTIFISQVDLKDFQCYVYLPAQSLENNKPNLGDLSQGFIIASKNMQVKDTFKAQSSGFYVKQSQDLLTKKYNAQLQTIAQQITDLKQEITTLETENQQLLVNASGLTLEEKQQVISQIQSNNASISSIKDAILEHEKSKAPIKEKIDALKTLSE